MHIFQVISRYTTLFQASPLKGGCRLVRYSCRRAHRCKVSEISKYWGTQVTLFAAIWNILDVLSVVLLAIGFLVRVESCESQWERVVYALSAPLLFSCIFFFVQVFRPGPNDPGGYGLAR